MTVSRTYHSKKLRQKMDIRDNYMEKTRRNRKRECPRKRWIEDISAVAGSEWRRKAIDTEVWNKLEVGFAREGI